MSLNSAAHLNKINYETILIGMHGCAPIGYPIVNAKNGLQKECESVPTIAFNLLENFSSIKKVIVLTRGYGLEQNIPENKMEVISNKSNQNQTQEYMFVSGYALFLNKLISLRRDVVFVKDTPWFGRDPNSCFAKNLMVFKVNIDSQCRNEYGKINQSRALYSKAVEEIRLNVPKITIYDPIKNFCDHEYCYGIRGQKILYFDDNHPSISASEILLNDLLK